MFIRESVWRPTLIRSRSSKPFDPCRRPARPSVPAPAPVQCQTLSSRERARAPTRAGRRGTRPRADSDPESATGGPSIRRVVSSSHFPHVYLLTDGKANPPPARMPRQSLCQRPVSLEKLIKRPENASFRWQRGKKANAQGEQNCLRFLNRRQNCFARRATRTPIAAPPAAQRKRSQSMPYFFTL